jgi:CRISPR system Cascade subunit CasB
MPRHSDADEKFIIFLDSLREDRAALAALRRGLGQPPGSQPAMYRYVEPFLHDRRQEPFYYLIAALFAYHPKPEGRGNMGDHFARARDPHSDSTAVERRFVALLAAHPEDLHFYLRQAVSFLRSKEIAVNWLQLLADLRGWGHPERYVQHAWARAFWGSAPAGEPSPSEQTHSA